MHGSFRAKKSATLLCKSFHILLVIGNTDYQAGGTKLERFLYKNQLQRTQRKLLIFEVWINGELSKIGHHFSNEKNLKNDFIKKC